MRAPMSPSLGKRLATRFMSIMSPSKGSSLSGGGGGKRHDGGEWATDSPTCAVSGGAADSVFSP